MKESGHVFTLTKNEQRVVVLLLVLALASAVANHYRQTWLHRSRPVQVQPASTPGTTPVDIQQTTSHD
jgi:hypothetical protein